MSACCRSIVACALPPAVSAQVRLGNEFLVDSYSTASQRLPKVTSAADGNFVVVWNCADYSYPGRGVWGQRFAPDVIFRDGFN